MVTKNVVFYYFAVETEVKDVEIEQMLNRLHASAFNEHCLSLLITNFLSQLGSQWALRKQQRNVWNKTEEPQEKVYQRQLIPLRLC